MQDYFDAANQLWLIDNIVARIKEYRKRNQPILLVQYVDEAGYPLSHYLKEIVDAVEGYDKAYYVDKTDDDGGSKIDCFLEDMKLKPHIKVLEVCGVNTDACVLETILSLTWRFYGAQIAVPLDCCDSVSGRERAIRELEEVLFDYNCPTVELLESF